MTTSSRLAAIVGAGLMGRWHARAAARAGQRVAFVIDRDIERARTLAARHGATPLATFEELSRDLSIHAVHICTPTASHEALIRSALDIGAHVLCEKPLAGSYETVVSLQDAARAASRVLVPVHQFVTQRGVVEAQAWLNAIAPLLQFDFITCTAGAEGLGDADRDRVVREILPHPLSLAARLIATSALEGPWHVRRTRVGELSAHGEHDGIGISLTISTHGRPTTNQLRLIGEAGTIHVDLFHGFSTLSQLAPSRASKVAQPFVEGGGLMASAAANLGRRLVTRETAYPGLSEFIAQFYRATTGHSSPPVTDAEVLAVARASDAIAPATSDVA